MIVATARRFSAALAGGDGTDAAAVYVEDAFLLPPTGDTISGRADIARFWRSGIEIGLRAVELEPVRVTEAGGVLYEHGRYRMLLAPAEGGSNVETGAYVAIHVELPDGSWSWVGNAFGRAAETVEPACRRSLLGARPAVMRTARPDP